VLGGAPVTTTLDAAGRATSISESVGSATPYTSTFAYNANDLPVTMTVPVGVQQTRQYDAASRLTDAWS
jgi:YD repeat-containing protein